MRKPNKYRPQVQSRAHYVRCQARGHTGPTGTLHRVQGPKGEDAYVCRICLLRWKREAA